MNLHCSPEFKGVNRTTNIVTVRMIRNYAMGVALKLTRHLGLRGAFMAASSEHILLFCKTCKI